MRGRGGLDGGTERERNEHSRTLGRNEDERRVEEKDTDGHRVFPSSLQRLTSPRQSAVFIIGRK